MAQIFRVNNDLEFTILRELQTACLLDPHNNLPSLVQQFMVVGVVRCPSHMIKIPLLVLHSRSFTALREVVLPRTKLEIFRQIQQTSLIVSFSQLCFKKQVLIFWTADTYSFTIPTSLPTGTATIAWTWFNKVGNREMYMVRIIPQNMSSFEEKEGLRGVQDWSCISFNPKTVLDLKFH